MKITKTITYEDTFDNILFGARALGLLSTTEITEEELQKIVETDLEKLIIERLTTPIKGEVEVQVRENLAQQIASIQAVEAQKVIDRLTIE